MIKPKKRLIKKILIGVSVSLAVLFGAFLLYANDYYRVSDDVATIISEYDGEIVEEGAYTIVYPLSEKDKDVGLVFYPGAKVEAQAYMPLLIQLADQGITSVLVEMPFNLAVFNINAANKAVSLVDEVDTWYLSGHSLGGAMASSYMSKNPSKFSGLILLAAYPINEADTQTLQIYGSNDLVLDQQKIVDSVPFYEILGGNHAYFGNYGEQAGDGEATITRTAQQQQTILQILEFVGLSNQE